LTLQFSFPGILPGDNILRLLKLMSSKNPDNDIKSQMIFDGGFDFCKEFPGVDFFQHFICSFLIRKGFVAFAQLFSNYSLAL